MSSRRSVGGSNSAAIWASVSCCRRIVHAPLKFRTGRPADPSQGVDERAALGPEGAADGGFRRAAFERRDNGRHLLGVDRNRAAAPPAAAPGGREASGRKAGTIIATSARAIFEQMPLIDPRGQQRVTLQVHDLPIAIGRNPHVADEHAYGNPRLIGFRTPFRQGLSCRF